MAPSIHLAKLVSVDGGITFVAPPSPPGPILVAPGNPVFQFVVTNTGDTILSTITLVDSVLGAIPLPTTTLAPGASMLVPASGPFHAGDQCTTVTASGDDQNGRAVTDSATACYFGATTPAITLQKLISVDGGTTFSPATTPPGPTLFGPTSPVYRFIATNTSGVTLKLVTITDSDLGVISSGGTLAPGGSVTETRTGTFTLGQHSHRATALGTANGSNVTAEATACFSGVEQPKAAAGRTFVDADEPPLRFPTNPVFRFSVPNTGASPTTKSTVDGSPLGPVNPPTTTLQPEIGFSTDVTGAWADDNDQACCSGQVSAVPVFSDISGPAPQNQIIDRLLESVALEERALAALFNAAAEMVQALAAVGVMGPVEPDVLVQINKSVAAVTRMASKKEGQLHRKLDRILSHKE